MKLWWKAMAMCQSMFCALPFPCHVWEEKARDRMLLCLPLLGLEIGAFWYLTALAADWAAGLGMPELLGRAAVCALPWLLTGFLHLDGFMDVTDAVRSWRSPERRREILKDSRVGSFSVIAFGLVLLFQFAAAQGLRGGYGMLILLPALSRSLSILAIRCLKPMETSQYAGRQQTLSSLLLPLVYLAGLATAGFLTAGFRGLGVLAGQAAAFAQALRRAYRSLEGMNGDISGYCITLSELAALALTAWLL